MALLVVFEVGDAQHARTDERIELVEHENIGLKLGA